eukprot:scaffold49883_cov17-Prasinocladus_malaysianus.AAC.2
MHTFASSAKSAAGNTGSPYQNTGRMIQGDCIKPQAVIEGPPSDAEDGQITGALQPKHCCH